MSKNSQPSAPFPIRVLEENDVQTGFTYYHFSFHDNSDTTVAKCKAWLQPIYYSHRLQIQDFEARDNDSGAYLLQGIKQQFIDQQNSAPLHKNITEYAVLVPISQDNTASQLMGLGLIPKSTMLTIHTDPEIGEPSQATRDTQLENFFTAKQLLGVVLSIPEPSTRKSSHAEDMPVPSSSSWSAGEKTENLVQRIKNLTVNKNHLTFSELTIEEVEKLGVNADHENLMTPLTDDKPISVALILAQTIIYETSNPQNLTPKDKEFLEGQNIKEFNETLINSMKNDQYRFHLYGLYHHKKLLSVIRGSFHVNNHCGEGKRFYLQSVCADPRERKKGYTTILLQKLREHLNMKGISRIDLHQHIDVQVSAASLESNLGYYVGKCGFIPTMLTFINNFSSAITIQPQHSAVSDELMAAKERHAKLYDAAIKLVHDAKQQSTTLQRAGLGR